MYHVEATFSNVTEVSLRNVSFTVANVGAGNVVLNADGGPAGAGAKVSVPDSALGAEGMLHMNESLTFSFDIGLARPDFSSLTVDASGVPHDWIHPDPAPSYDANNASFVFDAKEGVSRQIEKIEVDVQALVTSKYISQTKANVLIEQLDRAQQFVAAGKSVRAIQAIGVFIVNLNALGRPVPVQVRLPLAAQAGFVILQMR